MDKFLQNLFLNTKYSTHKIKPEFLQRKVGLGFGMIFQRPNKDIMKPLIKKIRREKEILEKKEESSSSEEISRISHVYSKKTNKKS